MANLRMLKKQIDWCLEEFVFDCDVAICYQPAKADQVFALMQKGVSLRNELYRQANNPAEPHNRSLVRKHYSALRRDIASSFESMFEELSEVNK